MNDYEPWCADFAFGKLYITMESMEGNAVKIGYFTSLLTSFQDVLNGSSLMEVQQK